MVGRGRAGGAEEGLWLISSPTIFFFFAMHVICNIILYFSFLSAVEKRWEPHIYYRNPQAFLSHVSQGGVFSVVHGSDMVETLPSMQFQNEHCRRRQMRKEWWTSFNLETIDKDLDWKTLPLGEICKVRKSSWKIGGILDSEKRQNCFNWRRRRVCPRGKHCSTDSLHSDSLWGFMPAGLQGCVCKCIFIRPPKEAGSRAV